MSAFLTFKPLSLKTTRSASIHDMALRVAGHNLRTALIHDPESDLNGKIDPTKSSQNLVLEGYSDAVSAAGAYVGTMERAGVKFRSNACLAIEGVVSVNSEMGIDYPTFFAACCKWIVARYDALPWLSVIHLDQAQPHVHLLFVPLDYEYTPPRLRGSAVLGNRESLRKTQEDFYQEVCRSYGLKKKRATRPLSASARRAAVAHAKTVLQANSGLSDGVLEALLAPHLTNPAPLLESLGIPMPETAPRRGTFVDVMTRPVQPEKTRSPIGVSGSRKNHYRSLPHAQHNAAAKPLPLCRTSAARTNSIFSNRMFSATSPDTCRPM